MTIESNRMKAADCCTELFGTDFLQALCEPSRASILRALVLKGRTDISSLAHDLPIDRSVISRHLQTMEKVGIVTSEKEGRHTFYQVNGATVIKELEKLTEGMKQIQPFCCP